MMSHSVGSRSLLYTKILLRPLERQLDGLVRMYNRQSTKELGEVADEERVGVRQFGSNELELRSTDSSRQEEI